MSLGDRRRVFLAAMMVTLKHHRFELGVAVVLAMTVAAYIGYVELRLAGVGAPPECVQNWLGSGAAGREHCTTLMRAWGGIFGSESELIVGTMRFLPFVIGLLGGVPLVSREFESRTVQTAWSLNGSRVAWLSRQSVPVLVLLGTAISLPAFAADVTAQHRIDWGQGAYASLGVHGPLVLVRAFTAFGVGLAAGALLGRALPAIVLAAVILGVAYVGIDAIRKQWVDAQPATVVGESITAITVGWNWRAPDGSVISDDEALSRVPVEILEPGTEDQVYDAAEWLEEHGYTLLPVGVSDEAANGWAIYDAACFVSIGLTSSFGAYWLVNRRRPG